MGADLERLRADRQSSGRDRLYEAVLVFLTVARERPHLYARMFVTPSREPQTLIDAASASQDAFLSIVADVVGQDDALRSGALLITSAHGIAGMEHSGQMGEAKWGTTGNELVHQLIALFGR
ncbi:TetR-like C-terminal domain-containing protein [Actinoplanes palleronii]|nr:TetR-like C-terminal domain-containing protein [Actinoplanes palleronii]